MPLIVQLQETATLLDDCALWTAERTLHAQERPLTKQQIKAVMRERGL